MNRTPIDLQERMALAQRAVRSLEEAAPTHWLLRIALWLARIVERRAESRWARSVREAHERWQFPRGEA